MLSGLGSDGPERGWLHAVPAGWKLLAVALASIGLFALQRWPALLAAALASLALLASLGAAARGGLRVLRPIAIAGLLLIGLHALLGQALVGVTSALRLLAGATLGTLLVLTTSHGALLAAIEAGLAPLARRGWRIERVSLPLSLMLRFVDHFFAQYQRLDDAYRARSGRSGGWRLLAPLTLRMLVASRRVADALHARGRR